MSADGSVGVGTAQPAQRLHVAGGDAQFDGGVSVAGDSKGAGGLSVDSLVGIGGVAEPKEALHVLGNGLVDGKLVLSHGDDASFALAMGADGVLQLISRFNNVER